MKIIPHNNDLELSLKRCYLPFSAVDTCSECGIEVERDFSQWYLSYPVVNGVEDVNFYCASKDDETGCGNEWSRQVVFRVNLEIVEEENNERAI